jgi:glycosyltransferase involved in cell wall biosynthesis
MVLTHQTAGESRDRDGRRMTGPRVSVVMPVYNGARYIAEAIASLQAEPGIEAEIIVVDDGSSDGSGERVAAISAGDARVCLYRQPHLGVAAARNRGIAEVRCDYVTFLDSDDICAPGRIARQAGKLAARSDVACVIGKCIRFNAMDADFKPRPGSMWESKLDICLPSATFRRDVFERFGPFDETLTFSEDVDFYFRMLEADARFIIEVEPALYYRRHDTNMTNHADVMRRAMMKAYHNSIVRRRRSGNSRPLDVFFLREYSVETEHGGKPADDAAGMTARA